MVNASLVETILQEQPHPGSSTTRQMRDLYNNRSGEEPIGPYTDEDEQFKKILMQALDNLPVDDEEDKPISYTVKLKDSDDHQTPPVKRRSIIKLPKESKDQSESDDQSSDAEKISTNSSITISKPFSPLFLNNMKKFGVSSDWLAKRSNSLKQSSYSRSSVKSNTSQLDAMIKSASVKRIKSNRKLSFIEPIVPAAGENEKENADPAVVAVENKSTPYDLSSEAEEEEEEEGDQSVSPKSKDFSLLIPRVNLPNEEKERLNSSSSSSSPAKEVKSKEEKVPVKRKRRSKKVLEEETNPDQTRLEHLKKLLRISGIKRFIKKTELEPFNSNKEKINYLKSLFDSAGFKGHLTMKDCEKFREKRDAENELSEIQAKAVDVKGHVKGGRTLRGQARTSLEIETPNKRKRTASSEIEENDSSSSDDDQQQQQQPRTKKRRILQMQASPEISDEE